MTRPLVMPALAALAAEPGRLVWTPLRPGVEVHVIYDTGPDGPSAALLRYQPGASIPPHTHMGYEHVLILSGEQQDERGVYGAGTFAVNPPGSRHSVRSDGGCLALLVWERAVDFDP